MTILSVDLLDTALVQARHKASRIALSKQDIPGTYKKFMPDIGTLLVIQFPGETIRCPVRKVISPDAVLIEIDTVPMAKSHSFEFGRTYGVRRRMKDGRDVWEAQKDRDFLAEQARMMVPVEVKPKKRLPPEALKPVVVSKKKVK